MTRMRPPMPGESFLSRYLLRPAVWLAYQASSEARFIRRHRVRGGTPYSEDE